MKLSRRKFLSRSAAAAAGFLLTPKILPKASGPYTESDIPSRYLKPEPGSWSDDDLNIAWIGHSTVLINFFGTVILTDPVLFERIGLYVFGFTFGPSRFTPPALNLNEIPKPDLVLLSHAHMDHTDYLSLEELTKRFKNSLDCVTAKNTKGVVSDLPWKSIRETDWGDETEISGVKLKAIETKHFGWRFPWEKDRSRGFFKMGRSYNAYVIEKKGIKILFAGDTAYSEKFTEDAGDGIEIAIMPIGAYYPWKNNHCNPVEALIMAADRMRARHFIPIHCNTFKQGFEPKDEPLKWLSESSVNYDINIGINSIGETFKYRL